MANTRGCVDCAANPITDADGNPLRLRRRVTQTVDQGVSRGREYSRGSLDPFGYTRRLALYQARRAIFDLVVQKPAIPQHASPLGIDNSVTFDGQINIVANATAKCASCILDDLCFFRDRYVRGIDHLCSSLMNVVGLYVCGITELWMRDRCYCGPLSTSNSTSNPLLVGIPVPCVSPPISRLDKSP